MKPSALFQPWAPLLLLLLLAPRTTWGLGDGDEGDRVDVLVDGDGDLDGIDGRVAGSQVDLLDDDEPGVALPDSGAQRLLPYPLDAIDLELPPPNKSLRVRKLTIFLFSRRDNCPNYLDVFSFLGDIAGIDISSSSLG